MFDQQHGPAGTKHYFHLNCRSYILCELPELYSLNTNSWDHPTHISLVPIASILALDHIVVYVTIIGERLSISLVSF